MISSDLIFFSIKIIYFLPIFIIYKSYKPASFILTDKIVFIKFNISIGLDNFYTKENQIRANHYHKKTDELFIILEGKIKITLTKVLPNGDLDKNSSYYSITKNDVFVIEKMTHHTFEIIEESTWINALSIKMDKDKPDIISVKN